MMTMKTNCGCFGDVCEIFYYNQDDFDVGIILKKEDNSSVISNLGKYAKLEYEVLKEKNDLSLVNILLHTGRHHQIRVQFASRNHPLYGDQRYGETSKKQLALFAYYLSFNHPVTKEKLEFIKYPDKVGIWKEFIC